MPRRETMGAGVKYSIPSAVNYRVAISGSSSVETIKLRFEVGSTSSVNAILYAVKRYNEMHPSCEVHQIRVSQVKPKTK